MKRFFCLFLPLLCSIAQAETPELSPNRWKQFAHAAPFEGQIESELDRVLRSQTPRNLCTEFVDLPSETLALYDQVLDSAHYAPLFEGCREILQLQLGQFWDKQVKALVSFFGPTPDLTTTRLSTREVPLSAAGGSVLRTGNLNRYEVALTFDDGPHPRHTPELLKILSKARVLATFFEIGLNSAAYPSLLRLEHQEGHSVGSHSHTHADLAAIAPTSALKEVSRGHKALIDVLGNDAKPFFRFPYGRTTEALNRYLVAQGLHSFFWSIDSWDWKLRDPVKILQTVKDQLKAQDHRGILLMHSIHTTSILTVPYLLKWLSDEGYTTVIYR